MDFLRRFTAPKEVKVESRGTYGVQVYEGHGEALVEWMGEETTELKIQVRSDEQDEDHPPQKVTSEAGSNLLLLKALKKGARYTVTIQSASRSFTTHAEGLSSDVFTTERYRNALLVAEAMHHMILPITHYESTTIPTTLNTTAQGVYTIYGEPSTNLNDSDEEETETEPYFTVQADKHTVYVGCRGPLSKMGHSSINKTKNDIKEHISKYFPDQSTIAFSGYDHGGKMAIDMLHIFEKNSYLPEKTKICFTFGTPLIFLPDQPALFLIKERIRQTITRADPVPYLTMRKAQHGVGALQWAKQACGPKESPDLFWEALPGIDIEKECKPTGVSKGLQNALADVRKELERSVERREPVGVICVAENNAINELSGDVLPFICSSTASVAASDLRWHSTAAYSKALQPEVFPVIENCTLRCINSFVTAKVSGTNMCFVDTIQLKVIAHDESVKQYPVRLINISMNQVSGKLRYSEVNWGKVKTLALCCISGDETIERTVKLDKSSDLACFMLSKYGEIYERMSVGELVTRGIQYALLHNEDNEFVFPKLLASIRSIQYVQKVVENNKANQGARILGMPCLVTYNQTLATYVNTLSDDKCDEEILELLNKEIHGPLKTLETADIQLCLSSAVPHQVAQLITKTLASLGTAATLATLNPAGLICAPVLVGLQYQTLKLFWRVGPGYVKKVEFLIASIEKDYYRDQSIFIKEQLLVNLVTNKMKKSLDTLLSTEINEFAGEFVRDHWETFYGKDHHLGMGLCVPADRADLAKLLWCVLVVANLRKLMADSFVVQVMGDTRNGKSSLCNTVFETKATCNSDTSGGTKRKTGYRSSLSEKLRVIDNPGLSDSAARGEKIVTPLNYYILCGITEATRNNSFIVRLAVILSSGTPFKIVITKCDLMQHQNIRDPSVWLARQVEDINAVIARIESFVNGGGGGSDESLFELIRPHLDLLRRGVGKLNTGIKQTDFMLTASRAHIESEDFGDVYIMKKMEFCKANDIVYVEDLRSVFAGIWQKLGLVIDDEKLLS
eukprot:TRINITY_DN8685_c1_g1_i1.p1 TRINITY_DN8685_c1_g1~~TRINITY_DN8685_c1_g1_i1.p1  ORF type:complete len:1023 (+),score=199.18 TRINITY_DN8685_c1_g1_i1:41-3109(+)